MGLGLLSSLEIRLGVRAQPHLPTSLTVYKWLVQANSVPALLLGRDGIEALQSGITGSLVEQVALHRIRQGQSRYLAQAGSPQCLVHGQAAQVQKGVWLRWEREGGEGK